MIKGILKQRKRGGKEREADRLLQLELSEIEELSALLMSRVDKRVRALTEIEQRLDEKIATMESLLVQAESVLQEPVSTLDYRYKEVILLSRKGLKIEEIASLLDIPGGEVEFIINMNA
ncbi:MAG: hypothetical protein GXO94_05495 [Nitrospirae bacterium]|nr:hypothetical protein [Nitrospirota bacterium]